MSEKKALRDQIRALDTFALRFAERELDQGVRIAQGRLALVRRELRRRRRQEDKKTNG